MKKKKIKKIKLKKIVVLLFFILILGFCIWKYCSLKITNIYVVGNNNLKEYEIIELSGINNYPKIIDVSVNEIEEKLLKNDLIKNVSIKKSVFGKIVITVEEFTFVFSNMNDEYVLSNGKIFETTKKIVGIPKVINSIPDNINVKLAGKMALVDRDIIRRISEIEYKPSELDNERFLFYMSDGNYVYITLDKIKLINSYNEIFPTLNDKKGILYLDSGNHFEIKNN